MKPFLTSILLLIILQTAAQTDYSGTYGYSYKVQVAPGSIKPPKDEEDAGPGGELTLLKIDSNRYKFWVMVNRGWPGYHSGTLDGILTVKKNKGFYKELFSYADSSCVLEFTFLPGGVKIEQMSTDNDCGFGAGVYINHTFKKRSSGRLTPEDFRKEFLLSENYKITVAKATIYTDSSGSASKNQYFIKGDSILGLKESDRFIYTEHLTANGKFVYGWLRKTDLNYR